MKTGAIYARVSSDKQKEEKTIGSQIACLKEFTQQNGYIIPEEWIFQDEGYSGSTIIRPGLEQLRDLTSEGQIETVFVYAPDRLSRKYAYQVLLLEEFSRHGVDVRFIKSPEANTPEEKLLLQFQGMIAEYERAQIIERSRRGKRYRAKCGSVNVLSGAPYGYQYIKKTEHSDAYYQVIEDEAIIIRKVYQLYTEKGLAIGAITRYLNEQKVPTRSGTSQWDRSTIWQMLKNPAYKGTACFGKTEQVERKKITRPLRQKGGYSARCSANRERSREQWIEIPVPAIVEEETYQLAAEILQRNKRLSTRRTKEPTLLQGLMVCRNCGYSLYRTSTRTSKGKIYYYRCFGSDNYRHPNGRVCQNRPIRQDYLDELVWQHVIKLLENPVLIQQEIDRKIKECASSSPTRKRKETLVKELTRIQKGIDKLLDAYQEDLLPLSELRKRIPELRKRASALESELKAVETQALEDAKYLEMAASIEDFLACLRQSANNLDVKERQRILRLVVKEILVGTDTITIKHSIPFSNSTGASDASSYLLRGWSHNPTLRSTFSGRVFDTLVHISGI